MQVFEIDGARFRDLAEFADLLTRTLFSASPWNGDLDALNDMLRGGFGTPEEGFVLSITNGAAARKALGYQETVRWYEEALKTCHPANRPQFEHLLEEARAARGETLFDTILDIFRTHGPGGSESEDNVLLQLQ